MNAKLVSVLTPLAAWALNLACPVIPVFVWSALIGAILSGDVTLAHLTEFLAAHNIKTFPDDPYPAGINGQRDVPPVSIQAWRNQDK